MTKMTLLLKVAACLLAAAASAVPPVSAQSAASAGGRHYGGGGGCQARGKDTSTYYGSSSAKCAGCSRPPPSVQGVQWSESCHQVAAGTSCKGSCAPGFSGSGASTRCTRKGWAVPRVDCTADPPVAEQSVVLLAFTTNGPCGDLDQLKEFYASQLRASPNVLASSIIVDAECDSVQGPSFAPATELVLSITQRYTTTDGQTPEAISEQLREASSSRICTGAALECPQGTITVSSAVGTSTGNTPAVLVLGLVGETTSPLVGAPFTVVAKYVQAVGPVGPPSSVQVSIQISDFGEGIAEATCSPNSQSTDMSSGEASFTCIASRSGVLQMLPASADNTAAGASERAIIIRNLGGQASKCVYNDASLTIKCCFDPSTDYCGAPPPNPAPGDLELYHMSCSSFPVKPSNRADFIKRGWCSESAIPVFARSQTGSAMWKAPGTDVHDWWVFHGCDGAGLMSDCFGGLLYLEHYIEASRPVAFDPETRTYTKTWAMSSNSRSPQDSNFNDVATLPCKPSDTSSDGMKKCWKRHLRSLHTHPGTARQDNLDSGMWSEADWKESHKPWWSKMIPQGRNPTNPASASGPTPLQPAKYYIGQFLDSSKPATGFVTTYPWVCNSETTDRWSAGYPRNTMTKKEFITKMWGGSGNWNGKQPPFSPKQGFIDCYYDNEPWSGVHDDANSPPPLWQAYMFWADDRAATHIWGYLVAEKGPNGSGDVVVRTKAEFTADVIKPSKFGPFRLNLVK